MKKVLVSNPGAINPCPKCGKERITVKTYREKINGAWVTFTDTACPDKACQKKLNHEISEQKRKREEMMKNKAKLGNKRQSITLGRSSKFKRQDYSQAGVW